MAFFKKIGHAIHQFFVQRDVSRALGVIENNPKEVLNNVGKAADAISATVQGVASTATNVANVAMSDNQAIVELHKDLACGTGSWLANNVRPLIALASFIFMLLGVFGLVPSTDWAGTIVMGYMGMRTVDKLGQLISAGSVLKQLVKK
jgi:hypothetical protein